MLYLLRFFTFQQKKNFLLLFVDASALVVAVKVSFVSVVKNVVVV